MEANCTLQYVREAESDIYGVPGWVPFLRPLTDQSVRGFRADLRASVVDVIIPSIDDVTCLHVEIN
jgi:hypothetical protein